MKATCLIVLLVILSVSAAAQTNLKPDGKPFGKRNSPLNGMPEEYYTSKLDSLSGKDPLKGSRQFSIRPRSNMPQYRAMLIPLAKPGDHKFELLPKNIPGGVVMKLVK